MRTGPDRMLMISLVVSATFAATSLAQIDHCGMKLTIPQVETVFRYRFEAEGIDATKETRIELPQKVATAGAELSQVIELPETLARPNRGPRRQRGSVRSRRTVLQGIIAVVQAVADRRRRTTQSSRKHGGAVALCRDQEPGASRSGLCRVQRRAIPQAQLARKRT